MNKKWIIPTTILIILLIGIIVFIVAKPQKNGIVSITGEELLTKLENKETFILVVTQDGCTHCEKYKPILNRVLTENNIYAYELDLRKVKQNESEEIENEIAKTFGTKAQGFGTPTTIFINDGIEKTTINRLVGSLNYNALKERLKERGFIK